MSGSAGSTYESCLADLTSSNNGTTPSADVLLQCIANTFDDVGSNNNAAIDTFFLIYAASLVFFMQTGFAMICAGCVRINNVQNTLLKNLLDACGASLGFYMVGYAFAFGGSFPHDPETSATTFIGTDNFFLMGVENDSFWLFQFAFCATCATIVAGTLAERCQMSAYLAYSVMLSAFVYPIVVHSIWSPNGFLAARNPDPLWGVGMIDFAGSAVVHLTGGMTALIATKILGPRTGRFYDLRGKVLEQPKEMLGHSLALQCLGVSIFSATMRFSAVNNIRGMHFYHEFVQLLICVLELQLTYIFYFSVLLRIIYHPLPFYHPLLHKTFILWFGWYGFNVGSTISITEPDNWQIASNVAINTTLSGAAGCITTLFLSTIVTEHFTGEYTFNLQYAMNGCLSGLVSITAGCSVVESWASLIIGAVAGGLYLGCSKLLLKKRIDDAVDAIPVHVSVCAVGKKRDLR